LTSKSQGVVSNYEKGTKSDSEGGFPIDEKVISKNLEGLR